MKNTTTKVFIYLVLFSLLVSGVFAVLRHYAHNISGAAPDALHFVGLVALIPMISSVGGKWATRKIAYIKNNTVFKPLTVSVFLITYISLIPWILSFFVTGSTFLYVDWSIVITSITISFVLFALMLVVFLRE